MALYVKKFGGSSVATPDKMRNIANRIVSEKKEGDQIVIVVSAMGDATDDLLALASKVSSLGHGRELDRILATGEQISIAMLALTFTSMGVPAISLTGPQAGILAGGSYGKASIIDVHPNRVFHELHKGNIVIVAGFQGQLPNGDIATLGRGGSDATAVALAGAMSADMCEIFTDVDGVYSADPRFVENAVKMKEITNTEMLELARLGAGVMQPRSVEIGMRYHIPIHVRSTFTTDEGTVIREVCSVNGVQSPIRGVAQDAHTTRVSVLNLKNAPGVAYMVFNALAERNVAVDMIVQSLRTSEDDRTDIIFTIDDEDLEETRRVMEELSKAGAISKVVFDDRTAKVSIVGAGMIGTPGVASRMFGALGKAGINIDIVSTSEISVSCLIQRNELHRAVEAIHSEFLEDMTK